MLPSFLYSPSTSINDDAPIFRFISSEIAQLAKERLGRTFVDNSVSLESERLVGGLRALTVKIGLMGGGGVASTSILPEADFQLLSLNYGVRQDFCEAVVHAMTTQARCEITTRNY